MPRLQVAVATKFLSVAHVCGVLSMELALYRYSGTLNFQVPPPPQVLETYEPLIYTICLTEVTSLDLNQRSMECSTSPSLYIGLKFSVPESDE